MKTSLRYNVATYTMELYLARARRNHRLTLLLMTFSAWLQIVFLLTVVSFALMNIPWLAFLFLFWFVWRALGSNN